MTKLKIVTYPAKILKQHAEEVGEITPEIKRLIRQMIETMYENDGIGLAAPQVGVSKQIIIVETSENPRERKGKPAAFLNPVITKRSGEMRVEEEGCLSLPGIFLPVKRAENVEVIAQTPEGKEVRVQAQGLIARIFQHEIDHLQGKLIIARVPLWKRLSIKRSLKSKEKILSP